jgi:hypothetical protein
MIEPKQRNPPLAANAAGSVAALSSPALVDAGSVLSGALTRSRSGKSGLAMNLRPKAIRSARP